MGCFLLLLSRVYFVLPLSLYRRSVHPVSMNHRGVAEVRVTSIMLTHIVLLRKCMAGWCGSEGGRFRREDLPGWGLVVVRKSLSPRRTRPFPGFWSQNVVAEAFRTVPVKNREEPQKPCVCEPVFENKQTRPNIFLTQHRVDSIRELYRVRDSLLPRSSHDEN